MKNINIVTSISLIFLTILVAPTARAINITEASSTASKYDVNKDGAVNIQDIVSLINYVLSPPVLYIIIPLNDTGITWGGNYPDGNNTTCTGLPSTNKTAHTDAM